MAPPITMTTVVTLLFLLASTAAQAPRRAPTPAPNPAPKASARNAPTPAPAPSQSFRCYVPQYRPIFVCVGSQNASLCSRGYNTYDSMRACCRPGAAFKDGCVNQTADVDPCFVAVSVWPNQECGLSNNDTQCRQNWGRYDTKEQCCAPGGAFKNGCGNSRIRPAADGSLRCWAAASYTPTSCGETYDPVICQRGWGVYESNKACCQKDTGAFAQGCGQGRSEGDDQLTVFKGAPGPAMAEYDDDMYEEEEYGVASAAAPRVQASGGK